MLFDINELKRNDIIELQSKVEQDEITERIGTAFDIVFDGTSTVTIKIPKFPKEFGIGLIVGSSGSGKSTLLKQFGEVEDIQWDENKCVASHFDSFDEACKKFGAVGFGTISAWLRPYHALSTGEKFRVDMARSLHNNAVVDEFTSVVNRECAISCSNSMNKYIRNNNLKNIVFASCHDDIIEYLRPDWVYNTDKKELSFGRCVRQRPTIVLEVHQCTEQVWFMFAKYHYLSADINPAADCYIVSYNNLPIAFCAVLSMAGKFSNTDKRHCVTEHRLVVLPDYMGMGIGKRLSEYVAELYVSQGYRYFAKTASPMLGEYRQKSKKWRATSTNLKKVKKLSDVTDAEVRKMMRPDSRNRSYESCVLSLTRLCYSHEYIGDENTVIGEQTYNTNKKFRLF